MAQHHLSSAFISGYISHGWPLKHIKVIKALICWWFDHMSQSMTHWNVHPSCLLDNHILTKSTSLGMSQMIRYMTMYRRLYIYIHDIYIYIHISCALYIHTVCIYIYLYIIICIYVPWLPSPHRETRWEATSLHALVLAHQARVRSSPRDDRKAFWGFPQL